jgi:hypothetical protein
MAVLPVPAIPLEQRVFWESWWPWIVLSVIFLLFLVLVTLPVAQYLSPYKSAYPLSQAIRQQLPADVT